MSDNAGTVLAENGELKIVQVIVDPPVTESCGSTSEKCACHICWRPVKFSNFNGNHESSRRDAGLAWPGSSPMESALVAVPWSQSPSKKAMATALTQKMQRRASQVFMIMLVYVHKNQLVFVIMRLGFLPTSET